MHKAVKSAGVEASTLITSVSADTGLLSIRKICCARSKLSKSSTGRSEEEDHEIITWLFMINLGAKDQAFQQLLSDKGLKWERWTLKKLSEPYVPSGFHRDNKVATKCPRWQKSQSQTRNCWYRVAAQTIWGNSLEHAMGMFYLSPLHCSYSHIYLWYVALLCSL